MFRAEFLKLKRSAVWPISFILPLLAVITGCINTANNAEQLNDGWNSLISQITLFYGLLFYSIGISLISAAVWRTEHRGTNWNLLATSMRRSSELVLAKISAIILPVIFMQAVLVTGTLLGGLVLQIPGRVPWEFILLGAVSVLVAIPLIALQSLLSMCLRSFAAPVAICLLGCVAGIATVTEGSLRPVSYLIPQALNIRALTLGSTALSNADGLTLPDILPLLIAAVIGTGVFVLVSNWAIRVIKLR